MVSARNPYMGHWSGIFLYIWGWGLLGVDLYKYVIYTTQGTSAYISH